ncbi:MAG TPA: hypothetical protein VLM76_11270 [Patescibacteria group bacterium]|nr:hypothetical protein [Patescibacteria group bacterium]
MPPVRRRVKAVLIDAEDVTWLDIGPPPRLDVGHDGPWRRLWKKRWPSEGADLMDALPQYSFTWAIEHFGPPRGRRAAARLRLPDLPAVDAVTIPPKGDRP